MKILHTSDWHLGKMLYGRTMMQDQQHFIYHELLPLLDQIKPDILLIAGDIFDRQIAPPEAIRLFDAVTEEVCLKRKIPIAAITGNHDGADRVSVGLSMLRERGLSIANRLEHFLEPIKLEDEFGDIAIYSLPFFEPSEVRILLGDDTIRGYEEAYRAILQTIKQNMDAKARNLLMAHCFVAGAQISSSESPFAIGGSGEIPVTLFEGFDYVALGHLHGVQAPAENVWYSGTPLKFSFDEEKQKKGLLMIDVLQKGKINVQKIPIVPLRDMRKVTGTLDEIINHAKVDPHKEDYIYAEIQSDTPLFEPMQRLREVYPNTLGLRNGWIEGARMGDEGRDELRSLIRNKKDADTELFTAFIRLVSGRDTEPEELEIFLDAMKNSQNKT